MTTHPLLTRLDAALDGHIPSSVVELRGEWTTAVRRTYASAGASKGPVRDVVDARWHGTLAASDVMVGMALLETAGELEWIKAPTAAATLSVDVSLSAYAEFTSDRATFTANLAGGCLPGVSVRSRADLTAACVIEPAVVTMGHVTCVARTDGAAFHLLLLPRSVVKVGRGRLWRVRDEIASSLPADVRSVLTRGRTGSHK